MDYRRNHDSIAVNVHRPYYGTYNLSSAKMSMQSRDTAEHAKGRHVFYNNLRSYTGALEDSSNDANAALTRYLRATVKRHKLKEIGFGIVEYFNYSVYRGMVSPHSAILGRDLDFLTRQGMTIYAYMHPSVRPSLFQAALDHGIVSATWGDKDTAAAVRRFASAVVGKRHGHFFIQYEKAVANIAEIFGPDMSLWLLAIADWAWASPQIGNTKARRKISKLLDGSKVTLSPLRVKGWAPVALTDIGVARSLKMLAKLDADIGSARKQAMAGGKARLNTLQKEVRRTLAIYTLADALARFRLAQAGDQRNIKTCKAQANRFAQTLKDLQSLPWPEKLSPFGSKESILKQLQPSPRLRITADNCG